MLTKEMKAMSQEKLEFAIHNIFDQLINSATDALLRFQEGNYDEVVTALKSAPTFDELLRILYVWKQRR